MQTIQKVENFLSKNAFIFLREEIFLKIMEDIGTKEKKNSKNQDMNMSFISENSAEEIKANFSDFSNIEFSDIITSSSEYTQSISDAHSILNKISSKLFQSEGSYSTLLNFFEQMKIIILDSGSNNLDGNTTVSSACTAILDRTIKIQDENLQMKLALQKFVNVFEVYFLKEMDPNEKDLSYTFSKDQPISYYTNIIEDLIKQFDSIRDKNKKKSDQLERLTKAVKDMRQKVEKMKKQKYISDAGVKRIERLLSNDDGSSIDDEEKRYDIIIDQIKVLQKKYKNLSKACMLIQSAFKEGQKIEEADPKQIINLFKNLQKDNKKLSEIMQNEISKFESSFSKIEEIVEDPHNLIAKKEQLKLEQRLLNIMEKINKLILQSKDLAANQEKQKLAINSLDNENKSLNTTLNQIKALLKMPETQSQEEIVNQIKMLKQTNDKLKEKQDKLVSQTKQLILQSKEIKQNLSSMKDEKEMLSKKREELREINLKLEEIVSENKKNISLLVRKNQQLKSNLDSTKIEFIEKVVKNEDKKEIKKIQSVPEAFNIFISKYNKQLTDDFYQNYEKILNFFDSRIQELITQISTAKDKHEDLIKNNSIEKEKMNSKIQNLQQIANDYTKTLTTLFPSSFGINSESNSVQIQKYMDKMKNITDSIFNLIPQIQHPDQSKSIYSLILGLRFILSKPKLSQDLIIDHLDDISENEIKMNEDQIQNAILYQNMNKIEKLSNQLYHSVHYNDVIEIIGDMIHVKPTKVDERSVIEMFNVVRERLEKAEQITEKFKDYAGMVSVLLAGVASKVPSNLNTILTQLTSITI